MGLEFTERTLKLKLSEINMPYSNISNISKNSAVALTQMSNYGLQQFNDIYFYSISQKEINSAYVTKIF